MSKTVAGAVMRGDWRPHTTGRAARKRYVAVCAAELLSALIRRPNGHSVNHLVDQAVEAAGMIFDQVAKAPLSKRDIYILDNIPTVLSSFLLRRANTVYRDLIDPAISTTGRIYDIVHESTVPAEAMISRPVDYCK